MSIELVMLSNHLILCHLLLLLCSLFPSIRVFSNESALSIRWPEYWGFSFSFSSSPSDEYSGLISFRIDWYHLLAVQHHGSKASILWHSAFFMVQLSHPYMTMGKTIALTLWTFVGKMISQYCMISRLKKYSSPPPKLSKRGHFYLVGNKTFIVALKEHFHDPEQQ